MTGEPILPDSTLPSTVCDVQWRASARWPVLTGRPPPRIFLQSASRATGRCVPSYGVSSMISSVLEIMLLTAITDGGRAAPARAFRPGSVPRLHPGPLAERRPR
jgi:hypothetical protein